MKVNFFNQPYVLYEGEYSNIKNRYIGSRLTEIPIGYSNAWQIPVFLIDCLMDWEQLNRRSKCKPEAHI